MDKMAQWKSSILGINKSSNGGPVKGKMPMSAPMAKYANGGRVVKMQEGGNPGGRPKERAGTWSGTRPKALAALSRSASSVRNSGDSDTDSFKSRIKKVSDVSISKPKSADYGGTDAIEDVATAPVKIIIAKATPKARKKEAPMTDAEFIARAEKRSGEKMFAGYKPSMPEPTKKSHGGKVMADGGAVDMKQDKAMIARHNRLMHSGQKSKLMNGGMVNKYAAGGAVKKDPYASDKTQGLGMMTDKEAEIASMKIAKKYPPKSKSDYANRKKDMPIVIPDNEYYMSGIISGRERQDKAKRDNALNAYANRGKDYIKDKLDDFDVAISKKIGLKERARTKESFREGLKEEGYNTGGKVMKKGDGGAMRVQGNMKRPQFSASKSFDGGKTRIGMSAGKGNFRASFSKKFADGGAVTRLANEASGVISDMTKNRAMMKKGGSVKKGSMMKAKGSMMKAMSNKR